jgi:hypothetical protein
MPRSRPGKKERANKRAQEQQALCRLNEQIQSNRTDNTPLYKSNDRVAKHTEERKFSSAEVQAIVEAAVTAAVTTTTSLLSGVKPKQVITTREEKPKTLAERISFPKRPLADRISFPKKN